MSEDENCTWFSELRWSTSLGQWVTETRTIGGFGMMRVSELVGKTVNIGDKDGGVWEAVTVIAFDEITGYLTLDGGRVGSAFGRAEARPLEHLTSLSGHDVARGFIHDVATLQVFLIKSFRTANSHPGKGTRR